MVGKYYLDYNQIPEKICDNNIDIIAIGHMGCFRFLPNVKSLIKIFERIKKNNKILRLYTPRIPQEHLVDFKNYLITLSKTVNEDNFQLVINDIGILIWLKKSNIIFRHVVLGSTISWSAMQNTLFDNIMRAESESLKNIYMQVNNNSILRIDFFKQLGIREIEVPNICEVLNHVEKIKLKDIRISVFEKYMLAGYSRVCMNMKVQNKESRFCKKECSEIIKIDMDKMWDYNSGKFPYFVKDPNVSKLYSDIYVFGNIQFRIIPEQIRGKTEQLSEKDTVLQIVEI